MKIITVDNHVHKKDANLDRGNLFKGGDARTGFTFLYSLGCVF